MTLSSTTPALSPSLAAPPGGAAPAFELKFLIEEAQAREVEAWAHLRLQLDPHGDPTLGGAYQTTSLYFDTAELDVYHRAPSYRRRKFRIRRYGAAETAFLERKSKWGDRVQKRRTLVPDAQLPLLTEADAPLDWPGYWFHRRLWLRRLRPACRIAYQRTAYIGECPDGPMRLTLDRKLLGTLSTAWALAPQAEGVPLLVNHVILEFKFHSALPAPFRELVGDLRLTPRAVSKYRLCRESVGIEPSREAADA